jgi:chorismate--pyruvate lyase
MLCHSDYRVPVRWRNWLSDRGSLTERLQIASGRQLRVTIIQQQLSVPKLSERRVLGLMARRRALIREVILWGRGQPWVYARSVLPLTTLTGRLKPLRKLDNRPLGALLFNDPSMRREPVQVAEFKSQDSYLPSSLPGTGKALWGRRSVFSLDNKPLLVSEIFLEGFK